MTQISYTPYGYYNPDDKIYYLYDKSYLSLVQLMYPNVHIQLSLF